MATKLPRSTDEARDQLAQAEWSEAMSERTRQRFMDAAQALGAVRATLAIGRTLTRGAFQRFHQLVKTEEFKVLGYDTVVDFFSSDDSPMTKNQYYDRLNALEREGSEVFDLLNAMKIPLNNRKLLAAGEIRIDGEEVVLGREDSEERVSITDRFAIKTLIASLAEKQEKTDKQVAALDKKIKQGEKDVIKYKREVDEARRTSGNGNGTPHMQALLMLVGAYAHLREEIAAYRELVKPGSPEEENFEKFWRTVIETIGDNYMQLSEVANGPAEEPPGEEIAEL